jgi:hypothetical protein
MTRERKRLAQLLHDPIVGRVECDVQ